MTSETAHKTKRAPARKGWVYGILVVLLLGVLAYFGLMNRVDRATNHDYYRVLYEATNTFNENLYKLDSMHKYKESASSIRSLLPSYSRTQLTPADSPDDAQQTKEVLDEALKNQIVKIVDEVLEQQKGLVAVEAPTQQNDKETKAAPEQKTDDVTNEADYRYKLDGLKLKVHNESFTASLFIEDILPSPRSGFSQYLFADQDGNVLATIGGEKTISIVDLSSINQQIQRKNKQFQLNFTDTKQAQSSDKKIPLPSYSNHVDMKISYGEFRVYVFPFSLLTPLGKEQVESGESEFLERLYLVGLLPEHKLAARDSGHWNISLLVVTIASLLFMWSMLRLYLLPKNQSITQTYRVITNVSSYLFYIVIIALTLAYFQKFLLQNIKDDEALNYAESLNLSIKEDLASIFGNLDKYRHFYQELLVSLEDLKIDLCKGASNCGEEKLEKLNEESINPESVRKINEKIVSALKGTELHDYSLYGVCSKTESNLTSKNVLVGKAATADKQYPTKDYCNERKEQQSQSSSFGLDAQAINILLKAYQSNKEDVGTLDFYSQLQTVELQENESLKTFYSKPLSSPLENKILSVFALNADGKLVLPSIFYQESNSLPESYNLSHRNYYKKVRDQKGWDLTLSYEDEDTKTFQNVYVQRLLNINNGTRGTTISMPLIDPGSNSNNDSIGSDHIIGADVLLPSLSLGRSPPLDFTYMIVERSSGSVIFHNDTDRSLVENLYFSGDTGNQLSEWIKAGLERGAGVKSKIIDGLYHGQKGRFALSPTVVNDWAIVIFYPNSTLQALMTNQFLFISVSFAITMTLMMLLIYTVRNFIWTSALKEKLNLPAKLNVRFVMLVSSLMLSASYSLYLLGNNIDLLFQDSNFSIWLPLAGLIVATLLMYSGCVSLFSFPPDISIQKTRFKSRRGAVWIISAVLLITFVHFIYIHTTAGAHSKSLESYYQQIQCNWLNYERAELISTGLSRYSNSVTKQRIDPLLLLPLEKDWYETLRDPLYNCDNRFAASNLPEDFPTMGSLTGTIQVWQWINNYLLGQSNKEIDSAAMSVAKAAIAVKAATAAVSAAENDKSRSEADAALKLAKKAKLDADNAAKKDPADSVAAAEAAKIAVSEAAKAQAAIENQQIPFADILLQAILLISIIVLWFKFNTKLLWNKLYCPERFMQHITRMTESVRSLKYEVRSKNLRIECDTIKLNGVGLALLLRSMSYTAKNDTDKPDRVLLQGFEELFEMSPCLQKFSKDNSFLPNLKLNLDIDPTSGLLNVQIWDIDTCLEKSAFRELLLDMIMELKSLTLANHLHSFTIFAGFHSLQRVKMKDPLLLDKSLLLDHAEYLSWAECLMDFMVIVPDNFKQGVDFELLEQEVKAFPELKFLAEPYEKSHQQGNWSHILKRNEELYHESNWATINYILLNADALYRFKWESCSSAEKLALLNLAKKHRINPANTQMIEHLVLNGLITVRKGHLDIVNRSFAQFVLHAETRATLNQLVSQGEAGVWKNYKLPLGIMILLIIGGIALTSGESIYIIAASLAGVLGTIASVTNSANMLRGGPKE